MYGCTSMPAAPCLTCKYLTAVLIHCFNWFHHLLQTYDRRHFIDCKHVIFHKHQLLLGNTKNKSVWNVRFHPLTPPHKSFCVLGCGLRSCLSQIPLSSANLGMWNLIRNGHWRINARCELTDWELFTCWPITSVLIKKKECEQTRSMALFTSAAEYLLKYFVSILCCNKAD